MSKSCFAGGPRWRIGLLICLTTLTWPALAAAVDQPGAGNGNAATAVSMDPASLSGTWNGVFYSYPNLQAIKLDVRVDAKGAIVGELEFSPAIKTNAAMGNSKGSYHVSGKFDAPSRSFSLTPGAWINQGTAMGSPVPFSGVFDARSGELAGLAVLRGAVDPRMLVLARDEAGTKLIERAVRSATPPARQAARAGNRPLTPLERANRIKMIEQLKKAGVKIPPQLEVGLDEPGPAIPTAEQFAKWASRIKQEKPNIGTPNTVEEKLYILARNLFADDYFKETFGTTYDQFDADQRAAVLFMLRQGQPDTLRDYMFLDRAFMYGGTYMAADITMSELWQTPVRGWMADMEALFARLPAEESAFEVFTAAETAATLQLAPLWPSESATFTTAITDNRARLAVPILESRADAAIASASGLAGAQSLSQWMNQQKPLLKYVPRDEDAKLRQRIDGREDQLLEPLIAQEIRSISGFGHGLEAVTAGNAWYSRLLQTYSFALQRPSVASALASATKTLQARRADDLASAAPAIVADIGKQTNRDRLDATVKRYLAVPGDYATPTAAVIQTAVDKQLAQLQHDEYLAAEQRREIEKRQALGASLDEERRETAANAAIAGKSAESQRTANVANTSGEPTQEVMYDLVRARYEAEAARIRELSKRCSSARVSDPTDSIVCLGVAMVGAGGGDQPVKITRFEKLGCALANGRPGYYCEFDYAVSGGPPAKFMGPITQSLMGEQGVGHARFLRRGNGWIMISNTE